MPPSDRQWSFRNRSSRRPSTHRACILAFRPAPWERRISRLGTTADTYHVSGR